MYWKLMYEVGNSRDDGFIAGGSCLFYYSFSKG